VSQRTITDGLSSNVRPRLLDLFCGAGGAAVGYHRAGFEVVGVDIAPQPRYPFEFIEWDALEFMEWAPWPWLADQGGFDAIHASPPCQRWSARAANPLRHPDLITPLRPLLEATGLPYVIENVPQAPLRDPTRICGSTLGLRVRRHRHFETTFPLLAPRCTHNGQPVPIGVYGDHPEDAPVRSKRGNELWRARTLEDGRNAMGIDWMTWDELCEAIPPAYTELIGHQLLAHLKVAA
jgi:DNA (cytosine-5)-methyltransferase 1